MRAQFCMRAWNTARSAIFEVKLSAQFFDDYVLENDPFTCAVLIKVCMQAC